MESCITEFVVADEYFIKYVEDSGIFSQMIVDL